MIAIRCGLCRDRFAWDISKGYPTHCKCCGQYIGSDDDNAVAAPHISTARKRGTADQIYRDMERKSEQRAYMAAAETGQSMSELSHLKMTNMKDGLREGDSAFSNNIGPNPVSQTMAAAPAHTGFEGGAALGIAASAGTKTGPHARAGTSYIQNVLKPNHIRHRGKAL